MRRFSWNRVKIVEYWSQRDKKSFKTNWKIVFRSNVVHSMDLHLFLNKTFYQIWFCLMCGIYVSALYQLNNLNYIFFLFVINSHNWTWNGTAFKVRYAESTSWNGCESKSRKGKSWFNNGADQTESSRK